MDNSFRPLVNSFRLGVSTVGQPQIVFQRGTCVLVGFNDLIACVRVINAVINFGHELAEIYHVIHGLRVAGDLRPLFEKACQTDICFPTLQYNGFAGM